MWIKNLSLLNFRNYNSANLEFSRGVNCFIGDNGSGKTSIVEALGMLPLCKSIRTSEEKDVIKLENEFALISAKIQTNYENKIKIVISQKGKSVEFNGNEIKRLSELAGNVKVVSFLPKDAELFKDAPMKRRKFIDLNLSMLDSSYLKLLGEYNHYLHDIRTYLKNDEIDEIYLKVIVDELTKKGYQIQKLRKEFIEKINEELLTLSNFLNEDEIKLKLIYQPDLNHCKYQEYNDTVYKKLINAIKYRNKQRINVKGIHNDDISMNFDNLDLAIYCSQGQNRISVISLKLAVYNLLKKKYSDDPIVILDDVLSELDENHQEKLINLLKSIEQVFITGTNVNQFNCTLYKVKQGSVRRVV